MNSANASTGAEKNAKRKYEAHDLSDRNSITTTEDAGKRPRTIGPSLPPPPADKSASEDGNDSESSDDSDDIGPSLPPPGGTESGRAGPSRDNDEAAKNRVIEQQASPPVSIQNQRDDWMLAPPDQGDWTSRVDPTKLRNRKFNTGRSAGGAPSSGKSSSLWTETPEQKRKRLENEVMGIQQPAPGAPREPSGNKSASDKLMEKRLQSYSDKSQRKALYKEHQETSNPAKEQDDPSARPFDREKDIAGPGTISSAKRREIINKSSDYTSRFSRGKFL
ncbi:hypothetical protein DTO212C5_1445 [Paecilomyces variotii]|nr:hypothetical protein DTO212C5_1445 [Paecilomyces variotii]